MHAVLFARPGAQGRKDQEACLVKAEMLGYRVEAVASDVDAAVQLVEAGRATVLLAADPRVFDGRAEEVRARVQQAGGVLEYCRPSPRRAAGPEVTERAARALVLLREAVQVLEGIPGNGRLPGRPTRRPRSSPEQPTGR